MTNLSLQHRLTASHHHSTLNLCLAPNMSTGPPHQARMVAIHRNADHLGIKYDELPQQPAWGILAMRPYKSWKMDIAGKVWDSTTRVGRKLTQEETDALAEHTARAISIIPYELPTSLVIAYAIYRRTASRFSFPLSNPAKWPGFDIKKFPLFGLDGSSGNVMHALFSRRVWTCMRFGSWAIVSNLVVSTIFAFYAMTTYTSNSMADPRLHNFREELRMRPTRMAPQPTQQGVPRPENLQARQTPPMQQQRDFSGQRFQQAQPTETRARVNEEDPFMCDDASPVTPALQRPARQYNANSGSSWDRLRAQASAGAISQGQQGGSQTSAWGEAAGAEGAKRGTSYTFSSEDEERAYAKEQAQRDFDEMLERERNDDFNPRK